MCNADCSLRLIAACCLLIIVTDSFVLQQLFRNASEAKMYTTPEVFHECYRPQMSMRIVFTVYAINSAGICFLLTCALMICDEYSSDFDHFLNYVVEYMFIIFGPVLFILCILGLVHSPFT
jgi:D-alanyl-D-alanine dipeptidase